MKLHLIAVGSKLPQWVDSGYHEYARRMPPHLPLLLHEIKAEPRGRNKSNAQILAAEAQRIEAALPANVWRVVLDERGSAPDTAALARRLQAWCEQGRDLAFLIGGADGLADPLKASADESLRLSNLTLPHALVRPLLAEALYRAWTLSQSHPYHRA